ncbi:MAG: alkaline phosphatase family protein [Pirellulales bacterium]|nr:alkaline phosphatase family protein [Pirellulales bacterium]
MSLIFLSIPGLRERDLASMPKLCEMTRRGERAALIPSFPAVTCPVQANMTTGKLPSEHGVIANGFYWRDKQQVEMWTAWNDCILSPQIWDILHQHDPELKTAVWFPLHSKGCHADLICTPAPVHNPDGSESLWCYTRPTEMYGELRDKLGHFPLQHFWGPLANIKSTAWIIDSAIVAAKEQQPDFFYIYLPHLDYAAQKFGPNSPEAAKSVAELDAELGKLFNSLAAAYAPSASPGEVAAAADPIYIVASEYAIVPVDHVTYPNRVLREAGLLKVHEAEGGELLDLAASKAWAMVDHQHSHIFTDPNDTTTIDAVCQLFAGKEGIAEVLSGDELSRYHLNHERAGQVLLVSTANSWQAYYWWHDGARAPKFARTVDIHRKPGYDPVELFFDPATRSIPLDATLVRGSHGAPVESESGQGVVLTSHPDMLNSQLLRDTQLCDVALRQFGC